MQSLAGDPECPLCSMRLTEVHRNRSTQRLTEVHCDWDRHTATRTPQRVGRRIQCMHMQAARLPSGAWAAGMLATT